MEDRIVQAFELLGIQENQYPEYKDPNSFASEFKICSLYEDLDITTTNSTASSFMRTELRESNQRK